MNRFRLFTVALALGLSLSGAGLTQSMTAQTLTPPLPVTQPPIAQPPAAQPSLAQPSPAKLPVAALAIGDSIYPRLGQAGLNVLHYDVNLTVEQPGTMNLRGEVTLTVTSTRTLNVVSLDLLGPKVLDVQWNAKTASYQQDKAAGKLTVTPPEPLRPGAQARVTVRYAGEAGIRPDTESPFNLGWQALPGLYLPVLVDRPGVNFAFSEPDGTRTFLPVNDHPSDPATFTVRITVPPGYTAAASGVQQGVIPATGGQTFVFEQAQPIPTYALAVHVNRFDEVTSDPVNVGVGGAPVQRRDYFPVDIGEVTRRPYQATTRILEVLSEWFGPYPFGAYGSAIITPRFPALETATLSTMPVHSSQEWVIVHEAAHQWFGNQVVLGDWADTWLNEGFATYSELLWAQSQGSDGSAELDRWYAHLSSKPTRPLVATREEQLFDTTAYVRGALALHAVRVVVGDVAFKAYLRAYVRTFSARPTTTLALLAFTGKQLGSKAEAAMRLWVESPSLPGKPTVSP